MAKRQKKKVKKSSTKPTKKKVKGSKAAGTKEVKKKAPLKSKSKASGGAGKKAKLRLKKGQNAEDLRTVSPEVLGHHDEQYNSLGEAICREAGCEIVSTSGGYCRLHYIKNWKKIKRRELLIKEGKLNRYIEELVAKYPDRYIEAIRQDLSNDGDFNKVVHDLELDEGVDDFDADSESLDTLIDNMRRDLDDEGESY